METSSLSLLESNEKTIFKLTKAAFHNSCGSNFVSLDFYENTHLSGTNGVGKSSKLNAIQIGYLPHCNFKDVEKKFYFTSKGKFYSAAKVFEYHFPEVNSYIVYEFQNPHGLFCQIVFRGKDDLTIERAFVPLSLDDIYHWFWTFEENDELGKPTNLSYKQLNDKIKEIKGHRFSKTTKENKAILYHGSPIDKEGQYSIAKIPNNRIGNLIDIFKLAVNATAIDDSMIKKTVVSLIEGTYINTLKDKVDFKPNELLEGFEKLEKDRLKLIKNRNFESVYLDIENGFTGIRGLSSSIIETYHSLYASSKYHFNQFDIQAQESAIQKVKSEGEKDEIKEEGDKVNGLISGLKGKLEVIQPYLNSKKFKIKEYEDLVFSKEGDLFLFNGDVEAIKVQLDSFIDECTENLKKYKSYEKAKQQLEKEEKELIQLNDLKEQLTQQLINIENLFIENPEVVNPSYLLALNNAFSSLPNTLTNKQVKAINDFSDIFFIENGNLNLAGISFGRVLEIERITKETIQKQLNDTEEEANKLQLSIANLKKATGSDWELHKKKIEDDKSKTKKDLTLIIAVSDFYEYYQSQKHEESTLLEEKQRLTDVNTENRIKFSEAKTKFENASKNERQLNAKRDRYERCNNDLEAIKNTQSFKYEPDLYEDAVLLSEVNEEHIKQLITQFESADDIKHLLRKNFNIMVDEQILHDDNGYLMNQKLDINLLAKTLLVELQAIYQGLDSDEDHLNNLARRHADLTIDLTKSLSHQIKHFSGYINRFNEKLAKFKLSNVDGVRLKMSVAKEVEAFIESVDSLDVASDDSISSIEKGLFSQVRNFINSMRLNNAKDMTLTGEKLVYSIVIEYDFGKGWETTEGSNGTSLTSSVMLLSLFIEQLLGTQYILSIPLNLDETSNVDFVNMGNIFNFVKERHLVLFSASPDLPLGADDVFKKFINLDDSEIFDAELLISKDFKTTYHYNMGSMFEPINQGFVSLD
tara:strand:+ start:2550 stop:5486 length:2937 start_codon:yes stop_codon:yes gene_type:complete